MISCREVAAIFCQPEPSGRWGGAELIRKAVICLLVVFIVLMAGYKAKIDWFDTYKEKQTVNLWLLLMQEGKLERAQQLVDEKDCRSNGFKSFSKLESYAKNGYFAGASISKMYLNDRGQPVARIELPGNPQIDKLLLRVDNINNKFQIVEIDFITRGSGPVNKILDWFSSR